MPVHVTTDNIYTIKALVKPLHYRAHFTTPTQPNPNPDNRPTNTWLDLNRPAYLEQTMGEPIGDGSFAHHIDVVEHPNVYLVIPHGLWISVVDGEICAGPTEATADSPIPEKGSLFDH